MNRDILDSEDARLMAAVRESSADRRRTMGAHLSTDRLLDYHEQELSADEAESVREHLALCPDCARRGLDLAAFALPEHATGESDLTAGTPRPNWVALRSVLRREGLLARSPTFLETLVAPLAEIGRLFSSLRFAYALAAFFFLTSVTLPWLVVERQEERPVANPQVEDLSPLSAAQRAGTTAVAITATGEDLVLSLGARLDDRPTDASYRAEIFHLQSSKSSAKWSVEELKRSPDGWFTMIFPGETLAPGAYGIKLYDPDDEVLEEYRFQIEETQPDRGGTHGLKPGAEGF